MNDKTLTRISLAITIIGIVALLATSQFLRPEKVDPAAIDESYIGRTVEVEGTVNSFSRSNGNIFIKLKELPEVQVVIFESTVRKHPFLNTLETEEEITVIGRIDIYRSNLEIIVETAAPKV